jgi:4-amino-4-deoxy-L-arabinose transferase-like glycosyltransferase
LSAIPEPTLRAASPGPPEAPPRPSARAHARELVLLFVVALALRVGAFVAHGCGEHATGQDAWSWGYEAACLGRSIADGEGYRGQWSRAEPPWDGPAPATGWLSPAYPGLLALLMRLGGGVTAATATALLLLQCALSAATCLLLWGLGGVIGGLRLARLAGWLLAFLPYSIWNAAHTVWDTTVVALTLTMIVELVLRYGRSAGPLRIVGLGFVSGLGLLVNPALVSVLAVAAAEVALGGARWPQRIRRALLFAAAAFLACLPWCMRNAREVGAFALRTNLGVELMVGNNDRADGYFQFLLHPSYSAAEYRRYAEVGEAAYAQEARQRSVDWIRSHPLRWAGLTAHRARLYWLGDLPWQDPRREGDKRPADDAASWIKWLMHASIGLGCLAGLPLLWRRSPESRGLVLMLLLFPVPYYLTHVLERYRMPIEPLMLLPFAALVLAIVDRARASRRAGG